MSESLPFCDEIQLHVEGRISVEDADRQERTAKDILRRLADQPGVILADEVGMGKTFVALAVAVSVALNNRGRHPVAVMVPSSLKEKWPTDFELFREKCLPPKLAEKVQCGRAEKAVDFLKLLDDPPARRKSILFVTHGAMSRGLDDKWVMLALIAQAIKGRWGSNQVRATLSRTIGKIMVMPWVERNGTEIWCELLATPPSQWLDFLHKRGIDPEGDNNSQTDDDPVPLGVLDILPSLNTNEIYDTLRDMPVKWSENFTARIAAARRALKNVLRSAWQECVSSLRMKLPLLILDEAHHLKNAGTRLASLFQAAEACDDANEIARGPLNGVFDRMLFLTATPFQLGHGELCSVLDRFDGVRWSGPAAATCGREGYYEQLRQLRASLDAAQGSAVTLDNAWGLLRQEDLRTGQTIHADVESWWKVAHGDGEELTQAGRQVVRCYERTQQRMKLAEELLKPWVIRHLKPRRLPPPYKSIDRRRRICGRGICQDQDGSGHGEDGIAVVGKSLLPFLLAARASSHAPESRPVFAEGLASSYEAFLHTRQANRDAVGPVDADDDAPADLTVTDAQRWYLSRLEEVIPRGDAAASAAHPKLAATVQRAVSMWASGEKVVVFCHYIATGRTLRQRISEAIDHEIRRLGAQKLGCNDAEVPAKLDLLSKRFFDEDSPIRRACDQETASILQRFPKLTEYRGKLLDIVRRNVRTPSFLVRFFPLNKPRLDATAMTEAMDLADGSGLTLRRMLEHFFEFLTERCGQEHRGRYIDAVNSIQTGAHLGTDVNQAYTDEEGRVEQGGLILPNVRLVNGSTGQDTRQRVMFSFNTPFYPEILIASSVMAEGVDLHMNCRFVIHHDLCWNPSTLEQRTGRIDRIAAKAERCGKSIHVYLPYVSQTQDEKMYRVVMDRERWFSVVMGENYKVDIRTTEKLAARIPLPESAAAALAFRLDVSPVESQLVHPAP